MKIAISKLPQKGQKQKENKIIFGYQLLCADKYFDLAPRKLIL
jgi:hypothetical protein